MVEEPFVNLRTAIESTRQAVLLKYYNELLELDPKTQPKQITAVTRCVDTLERHSREQEEQQTDNDIDKMIAEGRLPGEYVQRYRCGVNVRHTIFVYCQCHRSKDWRCMICLRVKKHPYEEFASRFWEEVARRYSAKDEVKKDMEENVNNGSGAIGEMQPSQEDRQIAPVAQSSSCTAYLRLPLPKIFPIRLFRRSPQRHGAWDRKEVLF